MKAGYIKACLMNNVICKQMLSQNATKMLNKYTSIN